MHSVSARQSGWHRRVPGLLVGGARSATKARAGPAQTQANCNASQYRAGIGSNPGHNLGVKPVVWIDYESAVAIHTLRNGATRTQRALQLASVKVGDKRASAGCVVVPEAFYDRVIGPALGRGRGIVYVMPEHSSWRDKWRGLGALSP